MRTPTFAVALAALVAALPAAAGAQQNLYPQAAFVGGVEARQYAFGEKFAVDKLRQVAFPMGVIVPVGRRFSFDIGTNYAITTVVRPDSAGGSDSFSSFTDTQIRASYVLGTDAVVASVLVNLPTGKQTTTLSQFNVASSASSTFLLFPVNSYGSGTSVTPGIAAAASAGNWNLGLAASLRFSGEYEPFSDSASNSVKYQPGVETRIRAGADRLLGQSRLSLGFTFSTFSNDELRGGGFGSGAYDPGNRFIVDAGLQSPLAGGIVSVYAWNYHRAAGAAGDSAGSSIGNRENVFTFGVSGAFPVGTRMSLEPLAETRIWTPEDGSGYLVGLGSGLRIDLSPAVAFVPGLRVDFGSITDAAGVSNSITGWGLTGFLRYGF